MHDAAQKLLLVFPFVTFTSGRRSLEQQAEVMAENILKSGNRGWIRQTYLHAADLQAWLDLHPEVQDEDGLREGFLSVMAAMPAGTQNRISAHLTGMAVDLKPLEKLMVGPGITEKAWVPTEQGRQVIEWIRNYHGTDKFLTREGGLRRFHWQVKAPVSVQV